MQRIVITLAAIAAVAASAVLNVARYPLLSQKAGEQAEMTQNRQSPQTSQPPFFNGVHSFATAKATPIPNLKPMGPEPASQPMVPAEEAPPVPAVLTKPLVPVDLPGSTPSRPAETDLGKNTVDSGQNVSGNNLRRLPPVDRQSPSLADSGKVPRQEGSIPFYPTTGIE